MKKLLVSLFALSLLAGSPALSREPELIDVFKDWSAFAMKQGGAKVCYLGSEPVKSEGKYKKRGSVLFVVTHRPAEKIIGEINFMAGYPLKDKSTVKVIIGDKTFSLFIKDSDAWAKDAKTDTAIVRAMIRGAKMTLKGTSTRGTGTTDTFSLKGFTAAYKAASKACKV